jgi:hypothetical protein
MKAAHSAVNADWVSLVADGDARLVFPAAHACFHGLFSDWQILAPALCASPTVEVAELAEHSAADAVVWARHRSVRRASKERTGKTVTPAGVVKVSFSMDSLNLLIFRVVSLLRI